MKHIAYKTVEVTNAASGNTIVLDYCTYLKAAIQNPLDGKALGVEEMRHSIRLLDAIDKGDANGADFEDADFEFLVQKVQAMKFTWAHPAFVQFVDDVTKGA